MKMIFARPRVRDLPRPPAGSRQTNCPRCGAQCWRLAVEPDPIPEGMSAACSWCAVKALFGVADSLPQKPAAVPLAIVLIVAQFKDNAQVRLMAIDESLAGRWATISFCVHGAADHFGASILLDGVADEKQAEILALEERLRLQVIERVDEVLIANFGPGRLAPQQVEAARRALELRKPLRWASELSGEDLRLLVPNP